MNRSLILGLAVAIAAAAPAGCAVPTVREVANVAEKLDPRLLDMVEAADAGVHDSNAMVEVMVGLAAPLDAAGRADLEGRGFRLRSEVGTVVTGTVAIDDVQRVAASPRVVKLEASAPMHPEPQKGPAGGEGPAE